MPLHAGTAPPPLRPSDSPVGVDAERLRRRFAARARTRNFRLLRRDAVYELRDQLNVVLCRGSLETIGNYLGGPLLHRGQRVAPPKPIPPEWVSIIDDHLAHMVGAGLSTATRQTRRTQLVRMARELGMPPHEVTPRVLASWFAIHPEWKPATRRTHRCTARVFFTWAHRTGRLGLDLTDALPRVRATVPLARPAPDRAVALALRVADPRAALMIRLASEAGLRRAEVAQVHTRDLIEHPSGAQLLVHGKGDVERIIPVTDSIAIAIRQGPQGHTPEAPQTGWLFPDGRGGHLGAKHVGDIVSRLLPEGYTMHTLRHRFATRVYRGCRNIRAVQMLLGHASVMTTQLYTAVSEDEVRAALMSAGGGVQWQTERLSGAQFPTGRTPGAYPDPGPTLIDVPDIDNPAEHTSECAKCGLVQEGEARSMPEQRGGTTQTIASDPGFDRQLDAAPAPVDGGEGDAPVVSRIARSVGRKRGPQPSRRQTTVDPATFAERLNRLFDTVRPPGGEPTSSAAVVHALSARGFQISAPYLSQLRNGVRSHPDPDAVGQLARFFGVRRAYFTDEDCAYTRRIDQELYWLALAHDQDVRRITSALLDLPVDIREEVLRSAEADP